MQDILEEALTSIKQHNKAALCIVTETIGSGPGKAGSKMLVYSDGSSKGTIGGGAVELEVIGLAQKQLSLGKPIMVSFNLSEDLKMSCGGKMQVYIEPLGIIPRLIVFGAGHVGQAVAKLAPGLGFSTLVIDPREDLIATINGPGSKGIVSPYLTALHDLIFDENIYIVITTPNHATDETLLIQCATQQYAYLGMIGSRRKVEEIKRRAIETATIPAHILPLIDMPIGIPIATETPAEIAISILAKLIDVKNKKLST